VGRHIFSRGGGGLKYSHIPDEDSSPRRLGPLKIIILTFPGGGGGHSSCSPPPKNRPLNDLLFLYTV